MTDSITLTGLVATAPRHIVTNEGLTISSFRLASAQRRFDRVQEKWIDVDTNWYTITTFRQLGVNCAGSISKGDRVLVTGRLKIREWTNGERSGTTIDIEAEAIGHDLSWGTSVFSRTISSSSLRSVAGSVADAVPEALDALRGPEGQEGLEGQERSESGEVATESWATSEPGGDSDTDTDSDTDSDSEFDSSSVNREAADAVAVPF